MKVYKLRSDRANYMNVYISPHEIGAKLGDPFLISPDATQDENLNWSEFWQPLEISFQDDSDDNSVSLVPDITWWHDNQLVLNQKAYEALKSELESYGEFLPLSCEGKAYWLFHVTKRTSIGAVDLKCSERTIDPVGLVDIVKITFKSEQVKSLYLFKTEYNNYLYNIYCTELFKDIVESADLSGLVFSDDMTNSPK
ncbi:MAG: hypothetical protein K6L81_15225 [Agarilytica sp.]